MNKCSISWNEEYVLLIFARNTYVSSIKLLPPEFLYTQISPDKCHSTWYLTFQGLSANLSKFLPPHIYYYLRWNIIFSVKKISFSNSIFGNSMQLGTVIYLNFFKINLQICCQKFNFNTASKWQGKCLVASVEFNNIPVFNAQPIAKKQIQGPDDVLIASTVFMVQRKLSALKIPPLHTLQSVNAIKYFNTRVTTSVLIGCNTWNITR